MVGGKHNPQTGVMSMTGKKIKISAALLASLFTSITLPVEAAKVVPSIRIEIPSQNENSEPESAPLPEIKNAPSIPFKEEDVVPDKEINPNLEDEIVDQPSENKKRQPAQVFYGDQNLPAPVRETRQKLIDAARTGDIEKLRPILEAFQEQPILSFEEDLDVIESLKASSGDLEGREILAILIEVLKSGYVHREEADIEGEGSIYIWPYFVEIPPEDLKPEQIVELFHVITAGDFEDMKAYGAYIFYRAGITPDGELKFFLAGD